MPNLIFLMITAILFFIARVCDASLVSNLKQIEKLSLKGHESLVKECGVSPKSGSACDSVMYKTILLDTHFRYFFENGASDTDYANVFTDVHKTPNAICLRDGFHRCLFESLSSQYRYALKTSLDCKSDSSAISSTKAWDELQVFLKMCSKEKGKACFSEEVTALENLKKDPSKKRSEILGTRSGYHFYQLGDDFILMNSCDVEEAKLAKRKSKTKTSNYCETHAQDCLPNTEQKFSPLVRLAEDAEEYSPLSKRELFLELKDFISSKASNEEVQEKKDFLNSLASNEDYLAKQADYYLKKMPLLKKEKTISQIKRILLSHEKVLLHDLKKVLPKKQTPAPTPVATPHRKRIPNPADGVPHAIVSDPKFIAPEMPEDLKAQVLNATAPTAEQLQVRLEEEFNKFKADSKYQAPIGDLLLDFELLKLGKNKTDYQKTKMKWEKAKFEFKSYVSFLRRNKTPEDQILGLVLKKVNQDFTKDYRLSKRNLVSSLEDKEGNCDARTRMIWGMLSSLDIKYPEDKIKGIEVFTDHVQPVLLNKEKSKIYDLVTGATNSHRGTVYKPELLLYDMQVQLNANKLSLSIVNDLLVAKSPESKLTDLLSSREKNNEVNSIYLIYAPSDVAFSSGSEPLPERAVTTFSLSDSDNDAESSSSDEVDDVGLGEFPIGEMIHIEHDKRMERQFFGENAVLLLNKLNDPKKMAKVINDGGDGLAQFYSLTSEFLDNIVYQFSTKEDQQRSIKQIEKFIQLYNAVVDEAEKDPKRFSEKFMNFQQTHYLLSREWGHIFSEPKDYRGTQYRLPKLLEQKITFERKVPNNRRFALHKKMKPETVQSDQLGLASSQKKSDEIPSYNAPRVFPASDDKKVKIPLAAFLHLIKREYTKALCNYDPNLIPALSGMYGYADFCETKDGTDSRRFPINEKALNTYYWTADLSEEIQIKLSEMTSSLDKSTVDPSKGVPDLGFANELSDFFNINRVRISHEFARTRPNGKFIRSDDGLKYPIDYLQTRLAFYRYLQKFDQLFPNRRLFIREYERNDMPMQQRVESLEKAILKAEH